MSESSDKPTADKIRKSILVKKGDERKLTESVELLEKQYADALASWHELTEEQRKATLAHSPILSRLAKVFGGVR